jgi:hypothetical protein
LPDRELNIASEACVILDASVVNFHCGERPRAQKAQNHDPGRKTRQAEHAKLIQALLFDDQEPTLAKESVFIVVVEGKYENLRIRSVVRYFDAGFGM